VLGVLKLEHARTPLALVISDPCGTWVARPGESTVSPIWRLDEAADSRIEAWQWLRDSARAQGSFVTHGARITLSSGGKLRGALLLERGVNEGPFTSCELDRLELQLPLLNAGVTAESIAHDLLVERTVTAALGTHTDVLLVVDADTKRVVWAKRDGRPIDWTAELEPIEPTLTSLVSGLATARHDTEPASARLTPIGLVEAVAPLGASTVFAGNCIAAGLRAAVASPLISLLSARERAVARLLARGYTPANIAAISGLAEHTVKTYVRRTYRKLGVTTRVELVRVLINNFPWLGTDP
jgi:DNA-binding CsgD family transcriptional regulator